MCIVCMRADVHTAAFVGVTVCASAPSPRHCSMDGSQLPSLLFLPHRARTSLLDSIAVRA